MKKLWSLVSTILSVAWLMFVLLTPVLGVWLASSLVAFYGGPRNIAIAGGVLLFPVLPLLWEWRATQAWNRKLASRRQLIGKLKRSWSLADRMTARTLFINLAFMGGLLGWFPKTAFAALATKGDWFLEGKNDPGSQTIRGLTIVAASQLEWLHRLANPNPYKKTGDEPTPKSVEPVPEKRAPVARHWPTKPKPTEEPTTPEPEPIPEPLPANDSLWSVGKTSWPYANTPHPLLKSIPADAETSIDALGKYFLANEPNVFQRTKAVHDWLVLQLRYDFDSLTGRRKPQDAVTVFRDRLGVCEGYARVFVALGKAADLHAEFITGDVREYDGSVPSIGHAWNAVELDGAWYLVDPTWDDPAAPGKPDGQYRTDYLFIPPSVAISNHFPEDPRWQLLPKPMTRAEFLRQAMTGPGLSREGLSLLEPSSPVVEAGERLVVRLDNPLRRWVMLTLVEQNGTSTECGNSNEATVSLACALHRGTASTATLITNTEQYGRFNEAQKFNVVSR